MSTYLSNDSSSSLRPPTKTENTYQLGPRGTFPAGKVQLIIRQTLEKYLEQAEYGTDLCHLMSKRLSEVRDLVLTRH